MRSRSSSEIAPSPTRKSSTARRKPPSSNASGIGGKAGLLAEAQALAKLVLDRGDAAAVAAVSGKLRWAIVGAYRLRIAPRGAPSLTDA